MHSTRGSVIGILTFFGQNQFYNIFFYNNCLNSRALIGSELLSRRVQAIGTMNAFILLNLFTIYILKHHEKSKQLILEGETNHGVF